MKISRSPLLWGHVYYRHPAAETANFGSGTNLINGKHVFYSVAPLDFQDFIGPSGSSYDSEMSHFIVPRFKDASFTT